MILLPGDVQNGRPVYMQLHILILKHLLSPKISDYISLVVTMWNSVENFVP